MKNSPIFALAAALLGGCGSQSDKVEQTEASKDLAAKVTSTCGTVSIDFDERSQRPLPPELEPGGEAYGRLKIAIDTAWASACDEGVIPPGGLKEDEKALNAFKVFNNPSANMTGIYPKDGYAILETPMYGGGGGELNVPEREEIEEALYCFEIGPPAGDNPEGRCLSD